MPKAKVEKFRHNPLHVELSQGNGVFRTRSTDDKKQKKSETDEEGFIDSKSSRKILQLAQKQQDEIEQEERQGGKNAFSYTDDLVDDDDEELGWEDEDEDENDDYEEFNHDIEEIEIDPEEEHLFRKYMPGYVDEDEDEDEKPVTLADKIMEKIREKEEAENRSKMPEQAPAEGVMLPPKVIEVYTRVGELLSRYRSGKLPKAFKIIPSLKNWQDILYVTEPDTWSTQAVYEATKLFVSNLKAHQAQYFIQDILLERFRDDVRDNGTLNYHLYRSLKKALYKPAAFFKGFLFPLCESGTCTLKEAFIAGSVLTKVSVPSLHSAAALLRLADMSYSGPNSLFIKILLDKKYALPYKVIDGVVFHFMRFRQSADQLPVIWHQSLLVFAQRYKNDITEDQKDALISVIRNKTHSAITPEIRRELLSGKPRDADMEME